MTYDADAARACAQEAIDQLVETGEDGIDWDPHLVAAHVVDELAAAGFFDTGQ